MSDYSEESDRPTRGYRLPSTSFMFTPNVIRWVRNMARSDRPQADKFLRGTFPTLPDWAIEELLSDTPLVLEDDGATVVLHGKVSPEDQVADGLRTLLELVDDGNGETRENSRWGHLHALLEQVYGGESTTKMEK